MSECWCEYFKNGVFTGISTGSYSGAVLSACLFVYLLIYLLVMFAHMLFVTEQFLGSAFSCSFFRLFVRLFGGSPVIYNMNNSFNILTRN